ncbi:unnamed protein product [Auanema sp. JU1783]|nr:unnamed protein product [Auanema sp. JU1783]
MDSKFEQRIPLIGTIQFQMTEDTSNRKSRRFCGLSHVRTIAVLIAIVEFVFLLSQGLIAISYLSSPGSIHIVAASIQSLAVASAFVSVVLMVVGIFCNVPALLVPHMLMQVLLVLTLFGMTSLALYTLLVGTSLQLRIAIMGISTQVASNLFTSIVPLKIVLTSKFLTGLIVVIAIGYIMGALINIWCFHVVMDCYRWLVFQMEEKSRVIRRETALPLGPTTKPVSVVHATDF